NATRAESRASAQEPLRPLFQTPTRRAATFAAACGTFRRLRRRLETPFGRMQNWAPPLPGLLPSAQRECGLRAAIEAATAEKRQDRDTFGECDDRLSGTHQAVGRAIGRRRLELQEIGRASCR